MSKSALTVLLAVITLFGVNTLSAQPIPADMGTDILRYVNEYRTHMGLKPLKMNDVISAAAEKHSHNMATHKLPFGHDGFDERMDKLTRQIKPSNAWAENVAYSMKPAKDVVEMWLHSAGHKKNIEGNYNLTGIGIARSKDGYLYFTQIFLNKGN